MAWPNNLPHQLTSFIGREQELDQILLLLRTNRLVTLTGAGGSGKTRLALQAADLARASFPDGAWLVELASISDPKLVPQIVATMLGVREIPDQPLMSTLVDYLKPLQLLLVLDNCEHIIEAVSSLAQTLLRACSALTILATSRQGLNIDGETSWRVPSLSLPDPHSKQDLEHLREYEAVQLFVERARQRRNDFALTLENAGAVAQLCYRLGGIPLAIELAAARIRVLSVEQIVERLDEQFRLLASPQPGALPRHKTLEAMMDWSYDLLSERERALFRALSVFAGSFALDAVASVEGHDLDEYSVIDLLFQLVDKSLLIVQDQAGEARYQILETIRQYAWKKAEVEGELPELRERHLAWCVALAEMTEDELVGERQVMWLERLEKEHDNLRSALAYAITKDPTDSTARRSFKSRMGLRLAGALVWFWYFRGYLSEGRGWLESVLAYSEQSERDRHLAKALSATGVLGFLQSDYAEAHSLLEQALDIWHDLDDKRGTAFALSFLGRVLAQEGDPLSRELGERSVQLFREIGDKWGLALSLDFLGEEAREEGRADLAASLHEASLATYHELGHNWGVALELSHFAQVSLRVGDHADARRRLEEAAAIQRTVGEKWMLAWTLNSLGDALVQEDEIDQAEAAYRESLELFRDVQHRGGMAESLHKNGSIALSKGDYDAAWDLTNESLELYQGLNLRQGIANELMQLGEIAQARGNFRQAHSHYREALTHARALGNDALTGASIGHLADLLAAQSEWEQAALLYGVADNIGQGTGDDAREMATVSQRSEHLNIKLEDNSFRTNYERGRSLPRADGIAVALHGEASLVHPERMGRSAMAPVRKIAGDATGYGELTRREVEVLTLIAEGLTDAQVAERLVLSTRTVQAHVRSIYSKLDITTRSAATRFAIEHGLV